MWDSDDIDDLHLIPPLGKRLEGYALNIRPSLMSPDLEDFVVTPASPARWWSDDIPKISYKMLPDNPGDPLRNGRVDFSAAANIKPIYEMVCLVFPNQDAARASSLGRWWKA